MELRTGRAVTHTSAHHTEGARPERNGGRPLSMIHVVVACTALCFRTHSSANQIQTMYLVLS